MNLRPLGPEPAVGFAAGVAPARKVSDAVDISRGQGASCPPGVTPYEAGYAPDRVSVGRAEGRLVLPERLLSIQQVAERLGVCRATVYAMVERGELPAVRIASAVRIHPDDLSTFLSRR